MHYKQLFSIIFFCLLFSCDKDSNPDEDLSIIGNWVIQEITYNGNFRDWGECGHLENLSFYSDKTFAWEIFAVTDDFIDCVPAPPAEGVWEYIDNRSAQLTDDGNIFEVNFTENYLYMDFYIEATDTNPEGIAIHFAFLKS